MHILNVDLDFFFFDHVTESLDIKIPINRTT